MKGDNILELYQDLSKNIQIIRAGYAQSGDLNVRNLHLQNHKIVCLSLENMINKQILNDML
jgi:hypothetical protein